MASQELRLDVGGLVTSPNAYSAAPPGALAVADNVDIREPGILESRRGFTQHSLLTSGQRITSFQDVYVAWCGGTFKYYAAGWNSLTGSFLAPDADNPVRFLSAARALYITTSGGIYKMSAYNTAPTLAGVPRAPGFGQLAVSFPGGGFFTNNTRVAYRVVLGRRDAQGVLQLGPPSDRCLIYNNSGGAKQPQITYTLPTGLAAFAAGDVLRFYRSRVSVDLDTQPDDEMGLVYERTLVAADLVAGLFFFEDLVADDARGVDLYTNGNEEGIAQANDPPPLATDLCFFKGTTIYANTTDKYRLVAAISGSPGSSVNNTDLLVGDRISFSDGTFTDTYEAAAAQNAAAKEYRVVNGGLSAPLDKVGCMQSLATVINTTTRTVDMLAWADDSGDIEFESRTAGGPALTATFSARSYSLAAGDLVRFHSVVTVAQVGHPFQVGTLVDIEPASTPDANFPAGVKTVVSIAANTWTYAEGGADIASVQSYTATHSAPASAWLYPTGFTTFRNSNEPAGLAYSKLDQPDAVPLENSDTVGDATKRVLRVIPLRDSVAIFKEDGLYRLTGDTPDNFLITPYDLTVRLACPETAVALMDNVWCLTDKGVATVGESSGVSYLPPAIDETLLELLNDSSTPQRAFAIAYESERRYLLWLPTGSDPLSFPYTLPITWPDNGVSAGQCFVFHAKTGAWTRYLVPAQHGMIDPTTNKLVLVDGTQVLLERKDFAATDYQDVSGAAIDCAVEWLPAAGQNPGTTKQFQEVSMNFRSLPSNSVEVGFASDIDSTVAEQTRHGTSTTTFSNVRALVPKDKARGTQLRVTLEHATAQKNFQLQSCSVLYRFISGRTPSSP